MTVNDFCPSCGRLLPAEGIVCPYCCPPNNRIIGKWPCILYIIPPCKDCKNRAKDGSCSSSECIKK